MLQKIRHKKTEEEEDQKQMPEESKMMEEMEEDAEFKWTPELRKAFEENRRMVIRHRTFQKQRMHTHGSKRGHKVNKKRSSTFFFFSEFGPHSVYGTISI